MKGLVRPNLALHVVAQREVTACPGLGGGLCAWYVRVRVRARARGQGKGLGLGVRG